MMAGTATQCGAGHLMGSAALDRLGRNGSAPASCSFVPSSGTIAGSRLNEDGPSGRLLARWRPDMTPKSAERLGINFERHSVRCSAATLADLPPASTVEDGSGFCGDEGTVLQRPVLAENAGNVDKKYLIHTFGCQMNSADSERMAGVLENMGYSSTDDLKVANIVVYNTCSIRDKAEQKVRLPQGVCQE
jgi:hypothetical protein